jgi:hypothetical protein
MRSLPRRIYQRARSAARPWFKPGVLAPQTSPYPGHASLVRSVVQGLRTIGADFNFNPVSFRELSRNVYAPANEALRQAAWLKRRGRIDRLTAGPVNALFTDECDGILRLAEIDQLIVASNWILDFYRDEAPELVSKMRVCPSGIDPEFWQPPVRRKATAQALVYWKNAPEAIFRDVETGVRAYGLAIACVRYGQYRPEEYRTLLGTADVAVFLSTFETQGLALAEAWSMNVPTLVWDPRSEAEWKGKRFRAGSSCPYLTAATGLTFRSSDELAPRLLEVLSSPGRFSPREWVLAHMTDEVCARVLHRILTGGRG